MHPTQVDGLQLRRVDLQLNIQKPLYHILRYRTILKSQGPEHVTSVDKEVSLFSVMRRQTTYSSGTRSLSAWEVQPPLVLEGKTHKQVPVKTGNRLQSCCIRNFISVREIEGYPIRYKMGPSIYYRGIPLRGTRFFMRYTYSQFDEALCILPSGKRTNGAWPE